MTQTVIKSLKGLSMYPVPVEMFSAIAARRSLSLDAEATAAVISSSGYRLATADVYMWLSVAPNISQGGQSFSFTDEQRLQFRSRALSIYSEEEDNPDSNRTIYGYKGSRL